MEFGFRASQEISGGSVPSRVEGPRGMQPKGPICSAAAHPAIQASARQLDTNAQPVGEGRRVSDHTQVALGSLPQKSMRQLKLEQAKLKAQIFFFSTILGRPVDPVRTEALRTIDHLVRIRETVDHKNIDKKSPKELGEVLHSLVAIKLKEPGSKLGLPLEGFGYFLSTMPSEMQAPVFREFFSQGRTYSPEELSSIKESLGQPSLDAIIDQEARAPSRSELPEGDLPAPSLSEVLEPEAQPAATPEEELRQIEEVESTLVESGVPLLAQAEAAKRLQDLKLKTEVGKKAREKLWEEGKPLYPPTIVADLVRTTRSKVHTVRNMEKLKELYELSVEIEKIESMGLVLGEADRKKLKDCKKMVLEEFVQGFLLLRKTYVKTENPELFNSVEEGFKNVEKRSDFKAILAPLSETRKRYAEYLRERKSTKRA